MNFFKYKTGKELFRDLGYDLMTFEFGCFWFYDDNCREEICFDMNNKKITKEDTRQNWEVDYFSHAELNAIEQFKKEIGWIE